MYLAYTHGYSNTIFFFSLISFILKFRLQSIHYNKRFSYVTPIWYDIVTIESIQHAYSLITHIYKNNSLHLILKLRYDRLSQSSGILLFSTNSLFAIAFRPTLLLLPLSETKFTCLDVMTWL